MRKIILLSFLTFSMFVQAQNKNKLHDQNFWKSNPTLEAVKTEISNGSHPSEMNTMDFDAVTLAPYMGRDSVEPFLKYDGKWSVILALTSNPSAEDFELDIYEKVIKKGMEWGSPDNLMFVVGATRPEKLAEIRAISPEHFFLVPGVGAQGGTISQVAQAGMNSKCGLLVNISRNIIFAGGGEDFAAMAEKRAAEAALEMSNYIR